MKSAARNALSASIRSDDRTKGSDFTSDTSLLFGLVRFLNYMGQEFERYASSLDLSLPEWRVMIVIGNHPDISAVEVADATGYSEMNVSRIVRRLLDKGYAARSLSRSDRRRADLTLTRKGSRIYDVMLPNTRDTERRAMEALPPEDIKHLRSIIQRLNEQVGPSKRLK
jgi:DNA-binding MarR family transcriptional regulator